MRKVRTAVFPVAGMGTRFLPATKASPKEMLPIVDKPLVQYAVEEVVAAGIERIVFVTNESKRAIEDHFDTNFELETRLALAGKHSLLEAVREVIPAGVTPLYIRQPAPLGLGHAVLCARPAVGDEPFAVILADDLMDARGGIPCLKEMVDLYHETGHSVVAVEEVPRELTNRYGIVSSDNIAPNPFRLTAIVEKPKSEQAPSTQAVMGRYVLVPRIMDLLAQMQPGSGGEIQLTDAIAALLAEADVLAYRFSGKRYDCGSKMGYLQATVDYGLRHPEVADEFREFLLRVALRLK